MKGRPAPREVFLAREKRLELHFHTSNETKFLHARAVCGAYGLELKYFRGHVEPYHEDYSAGKRALLERAVTEVATVVGGSSVFFVEDTSVRIEALSEPDTDFPGLAVKEWFSETSFEELDRALRARGNDRRAIVRSDVALHIPGLYRVVFFSGESHGTVADTPPDFEASPQYPWLTPKTFNGWFIPNGASKRIGEMSFEESWSYDFRVRALRSMIERLEEYVAMLNLDPHAYTRRLPGSRNRGPQLFSIERPCYIIVGRTCAGKTTFGERAETQFAVKHVDASGIMRMFRQEYRDEESAPDAFAARVMGEKGPDIVARRILELYADYFDNGLVITGFRAIEELNTVRASIPGATVVLIDASPRVRFERHLRRGREPRCSTLEQFKELDQRQWVFGLLRVAETFADIRILNEEPLEDYYTQIDALFSGSDIAGVRGISTDSGSRKRIDQDQLYRCLSVLNAQDRPMTCQEIGEVLADRGMSMRENNIAKTLRGVPELADELRMSQRRVRYQIRSAGRAYVRLMLDKAGKASD